MAWTRTFDQMKKDLGHWLGVDSSLTSQNYIRLPDDVRGMLINQARQEIALRRDLRFFEDTDTITTADGDQDYGLPSDWLRPYSAYYVDDTNGRVDLPFITRAEYDELYADDDDSDEGSPENICVYGEYYLIGPVPDATYSIYVHYFKKPVDLTGANDDAFLTHAWDAIFFGAALRGCDYLMEDSRRGSFSGRYTEALRYLSVDSSRSRWSGRRLQNKITGA
jgi:hypothetical protein